MREFEKIMSGHRLDREAKAMWSTGHIYQDGTVNEYFKIYRQGYAHARGVYLQC